MGTIMHGDHVSIDHDGETPLWRQLADLIRDRSSQATCHAAAACRAKTPSPRSMAWPAGRPRRHWTRWLKPDWCAGFKGAERSSPKPSLAPRPTSRTPNPNRYGPGRGGQPVFWRPAATPLTASSSRRCSCSRRATSSGSSTAPSPPAPSRAAPSPPAAGSARSSVSARS